MSSNPNKNTKSAVPPRKHSADQTKRMSSITRKLHWYGIRSRLFRFFRMDLIFFVLACVGWCADQEYTQTGSVSFLRSRSLNYVKQMHSLFYRVKDQEGHLLFQASVNRPLMIILIVICGLFVLQVIGSFLSFFREDRKIRMILSPINEIALRADALSRMTFSEEKFTSAEKTETGQKDTDQKKQKDRKEPQKNKSRYAGKEPGKYTNKDVNAEKKYHMIEEALENIQPDQVSEESPLSFTDSDLSGVEAAMNNLLLRMRDSYRQQARFVNDASHELRTPIAVILGYANMLDRWGKSDPKTLEEGISAIKTEAEHMNHLVEQLLFLARGDSGKTSLEPEEVSINDLMQEVYEESFMIDENHRYRIRLPQEDVVIQADPGLLKQAVRILIDNAAKYTSPGEEIMLSAGTLPDGSPYLQVQDTGVGIAESEIPNIFDRFYRSDEVRSSAGTGLGLAIAKWIVDKHKGHFEILSRQDLGTRIRIVLPKQMDNAE